MATITLTWTPAGGANSTGQQVQRKTGAGAFATIATLSASANTYADTSASDNTYYTYQIVTVCTQGGPTESTDVSAIKILCPTVDVTLTANLTANTADLSFPALAAGLTYNSVTLMQGSTTIGTQLINTAGPSVKSFSNLSFGTTYTYNYSVTSNGVTKNCSGEIIVPIQSTCEPVNGLTATVS